MPPKISKFTDFDLVETGHEYFKQTMPLVLRQLDKQSVESIVGAMGESIGKQGLRYAAALALVDDPTSENSNPLIELAAAYLVEYPGRLASLVGPWVAGHPRSQAVDAPATEVVKALCKTATQWRVELVQAVIDEDTAFPKEALKSAGFSRLALLDQMTLDLPNAAMESSKEFGSPENSIDSGLMAGLAENAKSIQWRKYESSDYAAWIDWMNSTYEGTSDCPELNGVRTTEETFAGYWASSGVKPGGLDRPEWWAAFDSNASVKNGVDGSAGIASAFMLGSTDYGLWELSYMGVASNYRSRGLGRETLRRALSQLQILGGKRLWLAVDHRNSNAIQLYEEFGFERLRHLEAWFLPIA